VAVRVEGIPDIRHTRTGEPGHDGKGEAPEGDEDVSEDAGAVLPCTPLEDTEKLEEERHLDEGQRLRHGPDHDVEIDEEHLELAIGEEQIVLSGAVVDH